MMMQGEWCSKPGAGMHSSSMRRVQPASLACTLSFGKPCRVVCSAALCAQAALARRASAA